MYVVFFTQALGAFAWNNYAANGFGAVEHLGKPPEGVILRGMMKPKNT